MLYPICPTCGALLANIQLPYQRDMEKLCLEYGIDHDTLSKEMIYDNDFNKKKEAIVNKYTDPNRYCCRFRLTNFVDIVRIVK